MDWAGELSAADPVTGYQKKATFMTVFPNDPSSEALLAFLEAWVERLEDDDYEGAFEMTFVPEDAYWTPDLMRRVISNYGTIDDREDGHRFKVSFPRNFHSGNVGQFDVLRFEGNPPENLGEVIYDLPLDGNWSDVTAIFRIVRRDDGVVLQLKDIHVL